MENVVKLNKNEVLQTALGDLHFRAIGQQEPYKDPCPNNKYSESPPKSGRSIPNDLPTPPSPRHLGGALAPSGEL